MPLPTASHSLLGVRCGACQAVHPIGVACCQSCGATGLTEFQSSGNGTIYTYTVMEFVPVGPHKSRAPYVIAVVETDDGMKLAAIVEAASAEATRATAIGDKVAFKEYLPGTGWIFSKA